MRRRRLPRRFPGRRPLRRGLRRAGAGSVIPHRLQQELRRAHGLMEQGNHAEAAVIFISLAEKALDRNVLKHGIAMLLQAGHAYVLAGEVEKGMMLKALTKTGGNRSRAAELLGWSRSKLWRKIKQHGLE